MFYLQSPSKYSPLDALHPLRLFSSAQNSFWTHPFWCLLVLLPFFVSPFPHWQNITLWGLFQLGKPRKVARGEIKWIGRVGKGGVMPFLVKNCWPLSVVWTGALLNHPPWNGQMHWKSLQKHSLKPNAASHNNTSWHTDTDGLLEHSPSRGSLYYKAPNLKKIILGVFFWLPSCISESSQHSYNFSS